MAKRPQEGEVRTIDWIERAMRAKGWNWAELSRRTRPFGISPVRYSRWKGTAHTPPVGEPSVAQCRIVARVMGITLSELLGDADLSQAQPDWRPAVYRMVARINSASQKLIEMCDRMEAIERGEGAVEDLYEGTPSTAPIRIVGPITQDR